MMDTTHESIPALGHNSMIPVYAPFRAKLDELREKNGVAFDYENPKDNKEARSHIYKLRQEKAAVEKARKEEKAASLEYGRRVDEQAKAIIAEIDALIDVHAKPLAEIEQREQERIERHEANIRELDEAAQGAAAEWLTRSLESMRDRLAEIEAESDDGREEFANRFAQAKGAAITALREAIAKREQHDAEQAELARLRREEEERRHREEKERIQREAAEKAKAEAERLAREERERAQAEEARRKEEAERREAELKLQAERAERRAAEAEKAAEEKAHREAEEKAKRESAEAAKREADKKHRAAVNNAAVKAFVAGGISQDVAKQAVTLIAQKAIPQVTISY